MTPDGMVALPESSEGGRWQWMVKAFVLLAFAIVILGTTYVDTIHRLPPPKLAGGEKTSYDRMKRRANWVDGSLARLVEYEYRLRSKVRDYVSRPYASFMLRQLHEAGSDILYGDQGWMYLKDRVALPEAAAMRGMARSAAEHGALTRRLAGMGMRLVVIPLPRKAAVSGEFLPLGYRAHRELDEELIREFRRRGVEVVDLLPAWDLPGDEPVYQRRDTHWSSEGLRRSAQAAAEFLGELAPDGERLGRIQKGPDPGRPGAMYRLTNTKVRPSEMRYAEKAVQWVWMGNERATAGDSDARVALCGTSFSVRDVFATFLGHYMGQPVQSFSFPGQMPQFSLVEMLDERDEGAYPDLVLEEIPNHLVLARSTKEHWVVDRSTARVFSMSTPGRVLPIPLGRPIQLETVHTSKPVTTAKSQKVASVHPGWLAHCGGGGVEMAIDLKVLSGKGSLVLRSDHVTLDMPFQKGWRRYMLPILEAEAGSGGASLYVKPAARGQEVEFSVEGMALVSAVDMRTAAAGEILKPRFQGSRCTQELRFPARTLCSPQGTLLIETKVGAHKGVWHNLEVQVVSADGQRQQTFHFPKLRQGGWIVVVPGLLNGLELGKVTLTGEFRAKEKPSTWVTSANFVQVSGED